MLPCRHLLALAEPPTAVFTHNDVLAIGAISAIYHAGLTVPHDISIVGYDDTIQATYSDPPLTTVKFPIAEMGRVAGKTILDLVRNGNSFPPQTTTLPVELIIRGLHSTGEGGRLLTTKPLSSTT